ncbi:MAG: hypothetical protein ABI666_08635 [Ferruginibacter sp.]
MKALLLILAFPVCCFAQYTPGTKLQTKIRITSDSGTVTGYFVAGSDSSVILSSTKRYSTGTSVTVPVNSIRELRMKTKEESRFGVAAGVFSLGFILTAGLTKNSGDIDNDGKTSFFELLFTAIEGSTSSNRRRRNTALIVGGAGGTLALVAYLLSSNKISLVFPLNNRKRYYDEKRGELNKYAKF